MLTLALLVTIDKDLQLTTGINGFTCFPRHGQNSPTPRLSRLSLVSASRKLNTVVIKFTVILTTMQNRTVNKLQKVTTRCDCYPPQCLIYYSRNWTKVSHFLALCYRVMDGWMYVLRPRFTTSVTWGIEVIELQCLDIIKSYWKGLDRWYLGKYFIHYTCLLRRVRKVIPIGTARRRIF